MLFLFFNCVCTAAPVLEFTAENYKEALSIHLAQGSNPLEGEENHSSAFSYTAHFNQYSIRRHCEYRIYSAVIPHTAVLASAIKSLKISLPDESVLPLPGNDAFLFRYNLF